MPVNGLEKLIVRRAVRSFWRQGEKANIVLSKIQNCEIISPSNSFQCAPWTGFLSLEMYFSVLLLLLTMLGRQTSMFATIIGGSIFLGSVVLSIFTSQSNERGSGESDVSMGLVMDQAEGQTPWIYIGPLIIGKWTGQMCSYCSCKPQLSRAIRAMGWLTVTIILLLITLGPLFLSSRMLLSSVTHPLFAVVVAWLTLNKMIGGVAWTWCRPFSKLTVICLLVHPLVLRTFVIALNATIFNGFSFLVVFVVHLGLLVPTLVVSLVLFLIFEAPFLVMKQEILNKN